MITIPVKTKERLVSGIKKFQPILLKAKDKDINESDTVTIISDMLCEIFGYDKYTEITSEYSVKKTFCDLAIKLDGKPYLLIEAKAIGLDLKEDYVRQAIDYGSNSGIEWVVLTNAHTWKVFKVIFAKPIDRELVYEFDIGNINTKKQVDLELLYYLCKEAMGKSSKTSLDDFRTQKQILSRFTIGQILLTDPVLDAVRKQIKKMAPEARATNEEIEEVIEEEIIKREVLEGEKAADAKKKVGKTLKASAKPTIKKAEEEKTSETALQI
jgi:hypothetical protein